MQLSSPKPLVMPGVFVTKVQDAALGLVEAHIISLSPSIQPIQILPKGLPTLMADQHFSQLGVVSRLTEALLNPLIQIVIKDINLY